MVTVTEGTEKKCKKYGSVGDGETISVCDGLACKSGIDRSGTCDNISTDVVCKDDFTIDYSSSTPETCVKTSGTWSKSSTASISCESDGETNLSGKTVNYPSNVKLQSKLFEDFLEDFNDLDLEGLNSEDKYAGNDNKGDKFIHRLKWKTYKKHSLYENAPSLLVAGNIDSEGEVADDKDCEYDFIIKQLSGGFIKLGYVILALVSLLF